MVTRRTRSNSTKARDRGHMLVGLAVAVANIDEVIALIRAAPDAAAAREAIDGARLAGEGCGAAGGADRRSAPQDGSEDGTMRLSEEQAKAILDLRLQRLTALGRRRNRATKSKKLGEAITDYLDILRLAPARAADHPRGT